MPLEIESAASNGVDISEKGRDAGGQGVSLNRRLFMKLIAYGACHDNDAIRAALTDASLPATIVVYADLHDPYGLALLACHEDPAFFVTAWRDLLQRRPFSGLAPRPSLTMFGRTYTIGYEQDLERTLITRPLEKITDPERPWAIWYPLRRSGAFERLPAEEQRKILMEHGGVGMAYGRAGLATDIRLASFGLDRHDNDFTIALLGPELAPLSKVVERMRKTRQTSEYLQSLGPFFVGRAIWQRRGP